VASIGTPALAAKGSSHWSKGACQSYQRSFAKKHSHASKAQKTAGNNVLKRHGCSVRIK